MKRLSMPGIDAIEAACARLGRPFVLWGGGIALSLAIGLLLHAVAGAAIEDAAEGRFEHAAQAARERIDAALASYGSAARSLAALHAAGGGDAVPDRASFHRYVAALDLPSNFPAIEGVSYAAHVREKERAAFIAAMRADRSVDARGYPDFTIFPAGRRPWYEVIAYQFPIDQPSRRLGFDMAARPVVARSLEQARDSGGMSASGQPVFLREPKPHYALGMRVPVYRGGVTPLGVEARRAAYLGSFGIAFSVPDLVENALAAPGAQPLAVSIYGAGAGDLLLHGPDVRRTPPAPGEHFAMALDVNFAGSRWLAHFSAPRAAMLAGIDPWLPMAALAFGFGATLLVYGLFLAQYRSRRAADEQRLLLDTVLDNLDAEVYLKDGLRRIRYLNAKGATSLGRPAAELIGRRDVEAMGRALADAAWELDRAVLHDGRRSSAQVAQSAPGAAPRQLWTVRVPMQVDEEAAVLCVATDVTELHRLKARADAASKAKSDFLSNMSHEIRTPMNSIIGMTHLALQAAPDARQRDYLEKIYHSGQHLLGIINDILDFSKIEAGMLELSRVCFMLDALMRNVEAQLGTAAVAKGLGFDIEIDPVLMRPLCGDSLRLEQVLLNFAGNAIKFSERGRITLRARLARAFGPEVLVRFEVEDRGIGIEAAALPHLFTPFQQADQSATRRHGGTGLGLAISRQLAELMGGEVGVVSTLGEGSTFWFTARLALDDAGGGRSGGMLGAGLGAAPAPAQARLDDCAVLLVEDNAFNQQVARELLEQSGAAVEVANNGQEALAAMVDKRFDCVLMDVQMPVMDGLEATRRIRRDPGLRDTLVVAMTANAGVDDRARCLAAGMNEFLTKPVVPELLAATIARCLGRTTAPVADIAMAGPRQRAPGPAAADGQSGQGGQGGQGDVLDLASLASTAGGDTERMRKYVFLFLDTARENLAGIDAALAGGDLTHTASLAHQLKSAARAIGAVSFGAICEDLEAQPKRAPRLGAAGTAQARALAARLRALLIRIEREVSTQFGSRDGEMR
ncbi:CHASE domain-containing protein [Massilia sp. CFBP9012]|uniref:CHASE domain-containing protein n=1 Tax=Massilia sp. CFBP9012 TaxID=3096531 RepID=UPI002A69F266|nr:CHASE domain-containing protein [Massilia sp. CFBP9012]MDY0973707.1 CHASE domain-containing protein [Massilia sp. CFBP9012]